MGHYALALGGPLGQHCLIKNFTGGLEHCSNSGSIQIRAVVVFWCNVVVSMIWHGVCWKDAVYLQVVSSTNGDMPPDDGGHSQQPIHPPNEVEVVDETKYVVVISLIYNYTFYFSSTESVCYLWTHCITHRFLYLEGTVMSCQSCHFFIVSPA